MAWQTHHRNNFAAGAFLLIAMIAAVAVSIVLAGDPFKSTSSYLVRFDIEEGVPGIRSGSKVLVGGYQVGEVSTVQAELPQGGGPPTGILVTIQIAKGIALYTDAMISLERPLLGSLSAINIPDVGGRTPGTPIAGKNTVFDGMIAPPSILRDAGWGDEERSKLRKILDRLDSATSKADEVIANVDAQGVNLAINDLQGAITDIREILADVRTDLPEWRERTSAILENAETFSDGLPPLAKKIDDRVDTAGEVLDSVDLMIDENRESVNRIVRNIEDVSETARDQWVALGTETLTSARDGAARFNKMTADAQLILAENRENVTRTLGNLRLASDQLKLTMLEVRAQPWRLLVRPDTKEFEAQVLYDSARSYAMAASDLRAASAALDGALARSDSGLTDPAQLEAIQAQLAEAFEEFKRAESQLLNKMIEERP